MSTVKDVKLFKKEIKNNYAQRIVRLLRIFGLVALSCQSSLSYAEFHGTITGATDYIARMYSKSNNGPVLQGNLDYQHSSGFYTGISLSNINFGPTTKNVGFAFPDQAQFEYTPYAGWDFNFAEDWRVDLQYSRYMYNSIIYGQAGDYNEFYAFLHYKDLLTAQVSFSDDYYGYGDYALFYELSGRYPLTDYLEFSSSVGFSYAKQVLLSNFIYWNLGLTGRYKFISLDLRYHDAYENEFGDEFDHQLLPDYPATLNATVVFSISLGF